MKLEPAPSLRNLIEIAVEAEDSTKNSNLTKPQIVEVMLQFYFRKSWVSTDHGFLPPQENYSDSHSTT